MRRGSPMSATAVAAPNDVAWLVTVTEPLPDCPSVRAAWARIATQSTWGSWRSQSKMRGPDVVTTVVPPATEPLQAGDAYVVRVGRWLRIRCRVVESSAPDAATSDEAARVFDATATALGGLLRARFRFTVFRQPGGAVMARAQERRAAVPRPVPGDPRQRAPAHAQGPQPQLPRLRRHALHSQQIGDQSPWRSRGRRAISGNALRTAVSKVARGQPERAASSTKSVS